MRSWLLSLILYAAVCNSVSVECQFNVDVQKVNEFNRINKKFWYARMNATKSNYTRKRSNKFIHY